MRVNGSPVSHGPCLLPRHINVSTSFCGESAKSQLLFLFRLLSGHNGVPQADGETVTHTGCCKPAEEEAAESPFLHLPTTLV